MPCQPSRRQFLAALGGLAAAGLPPCRPAVAQAAAWPERRVRLIVPAAPGASLDLIARLAAERLAARWGQPVVVEGKPGADGILALEAMLAAPPGEALLMANHGAVTVTRILHPRLAFDPMEAMPGIIDLTADQFVVAVAPDLAARDLAGLVALARERPGALHWTSPPGPPYLAMRAFEREAGAAMTFVGFRGVGAATVGEMIAGRLQAMLVPMVPVLGAAREGRLRILAVTGAARSPTLPEVPTSAEQGFPGFRQEGIHGLFGWRGMPEALRTRIAADAAAVVADPATAERLRGAGLLLRQGGTPASFAALLVEQRDRWAALAREFGANPPS